METFKKHPHWPVVSQICQTLHKSGYTAYLAGGCVRDALLGRVPKDFDVATDALPDTVEEVFESTRAVGKAFGVILVSVENVAVEVATFREDAPYWDGRHPSDVVFSTPYEDACRRDFTVNALFYDWANGSLIDYVDGQKDIELRRIRTVGNPWQRFDEDKLRLLRAVRFATQLDFLIEAQTYQAVAELAPTIDIVARERIQDELTRLLAAPKRAGGVTDMVQTGLFERLFPFFRLPYDLSPSGQMAWRRIKYKLYLAGDKKPTGDLLALLLSEGVTPAMARNWLKELKFANHIVHHVEYVLSGWTQITSSLRTGKKLQFLDNKSGPGLLDFWALQCRSRRESLAPVTTMLRAYKERMTETGYLEKPWVRGEDLKTAGIQPGPVLGQILDEIYCQQLEGGVSNQAEALRKAKEELWPAFQKKRKKE